jgi:hypothetical protein
MCTAGSGNVAGGVTSAVSQTFSTIAQMQAASANRTAIDAASIQRQNEIRESGSLQLNETMMQARAARAHSIAAASGSGINLGSNSFLASLQTTAMATANKAQVELENENNAQIDNFNKTQSELNAKAGTPTFMGWFINNNLAYLSGAYGGSAPPQTEATNARDASNVDLNSNLGDATNADLNSNFGEFSGAGTGNADESIGSGGGMGSMMTDLGGGD